MAAGGAEAAFAARGIVEFVDFFPLRLRDRRQHQLRHPVAALDREIIRSMVDQQDFQLAAVIYGRMSFRRYDSADPCV